MKKIVVVFTLSLCSLSIFFSCSKAKDSITPQDPDPTDSVPVIHKDTPFVRANFSIQGHCNASSVTDTLQYYDTPMDFINNSDTGKKVSYYWTFGDNNFSAETNPSHSYHLAGTYKVTLTTFYDSIPRDTLTRYVRVIIGQKGYNFSHTTIDVMGADNAVNDGAMVLFSNFSQNTYSYTLLQTDSLLNTVYSNTLTGNIRLASLQKTNSGNYILSGNYNDGNTSQYALSLIDQSGNLLWEKYLGVQGKNYFSMQTSDNGFITIGDSYVSDGGYTTAVKCDANGQEEWRISLGSKPYISNAGNIIETSTGYLFSALRNQYILPSAPELIVTQVDFNGNITQQKILPIDLKAKIGAPAMIAAADGTYWAYIKTGGDVYSFNSNLDYLQPINFGNDYHINSIVGYGNNYYLASGLSHEHGSADKTDKNGSWNWGAQIPGTIVTCTSTYGSFTRSCQNIIRSSNDFIAVSYGDDINVTDFGIFITRIASDGQLR
ncbi:PKD domain-containing protein [Panacibacter ginsenosidivorans]|uniref:PKD domain-containing protein n=1 Tax=Panacibacter ginsenosidivorans TaxID=1813871 RepID=A0A5B8V6S8_9BACT|nr:PKD domain-containing protein [Panacibacter ginsenosidivorans]QEC66593.1 PKD domain-containing protein [Panacibacter ginsenosidivorans]